MLSGSGKQRALYRIMFNGGQPRGHFIGLCPHDWQLRGHFIMFCPLERHRKGTLSDFVHLKGILEVTLSHSVS